MDERPERGDAEKVGAADIKRAAWQRPQMRKLPARAAAASERFTVDTFIVS